MSLLAYSIKDIYKYFTKQLTAICQYAIRFYPVDYYRVIGCGMEVSVYRVPGKDAVKARTTVM
jgi:hypothetical protein